MILIRKPFSTNSTKNLTSRSIRAQRRKTQNAPATSQRKLTDSRKVGAAKLFFVIRRTVGIFQSGSQRLMSKPYRGGKTCCFAYTRPNGYGVLPRLYIQKARNTFRPRTLTLQRKQMRRAVSVNGCRNERSQ